MIEQIIDGAERAFLASGYDLATMDLVARHAGVARASVYNNFASKEVLFLAVMRRGINGFVDRAIGLDDPSDPAMQRLRRVASTFLRAATDPDSVEMYRTVAAHCTRFPELSQTLSDLGLARIEARFRTLAEAVGQDWIANPGQFAQQLLAILMGGFFARRLLGLEGVPTDQEIASCVDGAIDALIRGT